MNSALFFDASSVAARLDARSLPVRMLLCLASAAAIGTVVHLQYQAITPRLSPMASACEERLKDRLGAGYRRVSISDSGEKNVRGDRLIFIQYGGTDASGAAMRETEVCRYDRQGKLLGESATKFGIERMVDTLTRP